MDELLTMTDEHDEWCHLKSSKSDQARRDSEDIN